MSATKELEPKPIAVDLDKHQADLARRQAEHDAKREELLKCLNPAYAAQRENEKPVYRWTVSGNWMGLGDRDGIANYESEQAVTAQNESDAWSAFCDRIGHWPSRRDCKPVIKRGKQLSQSQVAAMTVSNSDADAAIPTVRLGAKPKARKPL